MIETKVRDSKHCIEERSHLRDNKLVAISCAADRELEKSSDTMLYDHDCKNIDTKVVDMILTENMLIWKQSIRRHKIRGHGTTHGHWRLCIRSCPLLSHEGP